MTDFDPAEKMPYLCHNVVGSPAEFLLDCQDSVDNGAALCEIHHHDPDTTNSFSLRVTHNPF